MLYNNFLKFPNKDIPEPSSINADILFWLLKYKYINPKILEIDVQEKNNIFTIVYFSSHILYYYIQFI